MSDNRGRSTSMVTARCVGYKWSMPTWVVAIAIVLIAGAAGTREYLRWRGKRWHKSGPRGDQD